MTAFAAEITGLFALHIRLAKMDGHRIDKKVARFNDMTCMAVHYGSCGGAFDENVARSSFQDVLDMCVIGSPMHIPGESLLMQISREEWMHGFTSRETK